MGMPLDLADSICRKASRRFWSIVKPSKVKVTLMSSRSSAMALATRARMSGHVIPARSPTGLQASRMHVRAGWQGRSQTGSDVSWQASGMQFVKSQRIGPVHATGIGMPVKHKSGLQELLPDRHTGLPQVPGTLWYTVHGSGGGWPQVPGTLAIWHGSGVGLPHVPGAFEYTAQGSGTHEDVGWQGRGWPQVPGTLAIWHGSGVGLPHVPGA